MRIEIDVFGEQLVTREILRMGQRSGSAAPAFARIANDILDINQLQFSSEGAARSGGWPDIKPATRRRKERLGQDLRILHATFLLRDSLTQAGDPNQILEISDTELRFGSTVPYGGSHQFGVPGANLPRRRPVEFNEDDKLSFVKTLQRFIVTGSL